jgi:hypothetical protein
MAINFEANCLIMLIRHFLETSNFSAQRYSLELALLIQVVIFIICAM